MTVKLLCDWTDSRDGKRYKALNSLTTDSGTEAGLVAARIAEANLTGSTSYVPPVSQKQRWPVMGEYDPVTGGIGILGPDGKQMAGNSAPYAFTSRALTDADNGMSLKCASAQAATVNTGLAVGFGCAFKGAVSFAGSATVTDVRTTGATNPWCALMATGTDAYDVVGSKA